MAVYKMSHRVSVGYQSCNSNVCRPAAPPDQAPVFMQHDDHYPNFALDYSSLCDVSIGFGNSAGWMCFAWKVVWRSAA